VIALLGLLRRQRTGVLALVVVVGLYFVVSLPQSSAEAKGNMASRYAFVGQSIAMPASDKQQSIRKVNQAYKHIDGWMSSVGAAVAMNDLDGDGLSNDLCLVEPRTDQVIITSTPGKNAKRYEPFALSTAPLPVDDTMAPMGSVPADFNEDGRMDLLVYMWGRTPILYLQKANHGALSADSFAPTELVPGNTADGKYTGPQWNTNAATVGDFDGDGHADARCSTRARTAACRCPTRCRTPRTAEGNTSCCPRAARPATTRTPPSSSLPRTPSLRTPTTAGHWR